MKNFLAGDLRHRIMDRGCSTLHPIKFKLLCSRVLLNALPFYRIVSKGYFIFLVKWRDVYVLARNSMEENKRTDMCDRVCEHQQQRRNILHMQ
jgi:hypothetical protein